MKNFTLKLFTFLFMFSLVTQAQDSRKQIENNNQKFELTDQTIQSLNNSGYARCLTDEYEASLKKQYPNRSSSEEFEAWLAPKIEQIKADRLAGRNLQTVYNIPVVIHIIHNGDAIGTGENITDAQALSQIQVMNEDYRRLAGTPGGANTTGLAVDVEINFCIAEVDPNGAATSGIVRHNITPYSNNVTDGAGGPDWETNADVQTMKQNTQWDPTQYLNMWTIRPGGLSIQQGGLNGLLGYAQFPDNTPNLPGLNATGGIASTDGVVAAYDAMGTIAEDDGTFLLNPTYNLGRTMTHEVGHWLGLRHIWGDGGCSVDDFCADTPVAGDANYTCNLNADSCPASAGNDQVQNYMDYTNDACMDTFTQNQKDRIQAIMANSPRRVELNSSTACSIAPTVYISSTLPDATIEGSDCNFTDITIDLAIAQGASASATASISNSGTAVENEDFEFINNSVTFASGSTTPSNPITLRIFNDNFVEADETIILSVNVTTTGDALATTNTYEIVITNDDETLGSTYTATYFSDNFDDEDISDWTLTDADGDGNNFGDQFTLGPVPNPALMSRSWISVPLFPDNWAVTPAFDLSSATGTITMSWTTQVAAASWDEEKYSVYVGTTNNIATLVNSTTTLTEVLGDAANTGSVVSHTLDISALAGQSNVYIAFRHWDCTDQDYLAIDNLTVTEEVTTNVQTTVNTGTPDQINLPSSGLVYSTDPTSGDVMVDIDNTSGFDYGCTTVAVSRDVAAAGADAVAYNGGTDPAGYVTAKTFDITTTNASTTDASTINFYFTQAEITAWETATGNTINDLYVLNETTGEVVALTNSAFGSDYKLTASFSMGISGTYYFGSQLAFLAVNDFELANSISIYPNPTVSILNIKVDNQNDMPDAYKIYNMLGQLLIDNKINSTNDLTIDTTPFSNGMYFIKISKSNRNLTLPFIKK